jgi:hypothetical protein
VHGIDAEAKVLIRPKLTRRFSQKLQPCLVDPGLRHVESLGYPSALPSVYLDPQRTLMTASTQYSTLLVPTRLRELREEAKGGPCWWTAHSR